MLVNSQNTINMALYEKLNFDFIHDIAPIVWIDKVPLVMEVNPVAAGQERPPNSSPTRRPIQAS